MGKTILAVWHEAGRGKTQTLREFANLLLLTYPHYNPIFPVPASVPVRGDFRLVVEINNKIIGIESQGDPNTKLQDRLIYLADVYYCEVILCTTRTSGQTVAAVEYLCRNRKFADVWTSTYEITRANQPFANNIKAKHILELLQGLGVIV